MSGISNDGNHQSVCRMFGYALTLGDDAEAWDGLSLVLRYRLTGYERACVLMAASRSLPAYDVVSVLEAIEEREGIGMPLPPFLDYMDDATWWADHASINERKAVLVASFTSLTAKEQANFLTYASGRSAA